MPNTKGKYATPDVVENKIASDIRAAVQNAMGRKPYDHNDTEAIKERILTYFDECAKSGKPPRIEGLTNALDVSRMTLLNWQKEGGERGELIRRAKGVVSDLLETWSMEGAIPSIHWMFMAKTAFGYIENNRTIYAIESSNTLSNIEPPNVAEIEKRLKNAEPVGCSDDDLIKLLETEGGPVSQGTLHDKKENREEE